MTDGVLETSVRTARLADAPGIVAVLNSIIESEAQVAFSDPITLEDEHRYIADVTERGVFQVAISFDGSVVGFQSVEPFAASQGAFDHVGMIGTYVDSASRRQGVATALFEATLCDARAKGFEKVMAFVRSDNSAGLATYSAHGFRIIGTAERHARVRGAYFDETILERIL